MYLLIEIMDFDYILHFLQWETGNTLQREMEAHCSAELFTNPNQKHFNKIIT